MESETFAEEFTAAMNTRGLLTAPALAQQLDLSRHQRLLDIAGGSGVFACALAERFPELRASVLEKAPVDRIAARSIQRRGLGDRVDTVIGDMLAEPLPGGYDVHLLSNVVHDWDDDVVRQLLGASAAALPPGGLLIIHDTFLNATKTGPLPIAEYLGAPDARHPGSLLFGRRDRVMADGGRLFLPRTRPKRDWAQRRNHSRSRPDVPIRAIKTRT